MSFWKLFHKRLKRRDSFFFSQKLIPALARSRTPPLARYGEKSCALPRAVVILGHRAEDPDNSKRRFICPYCFKNRLRADWILGPVAEDDKSVGRFVCAALQPACGSEYGAEG
jgi:hypothetical protein